MRNLSLVTLLLLFFGSSFNVVAQQRLALYNSPDQLGPNWSSWESFQTSQKPKQRKTLLFIFTDWCSWCKKMEGETFSQPGVSKYMNEHFNLIRFNAEQKEEINFKGKKYGFIRVGSKGYNEWVAVLLNGQVSFPSIVFLDEAGEVVQPISGFKSPEQLLLIMQYVYSNAYQHTPWTTYQKTARPPGS